MKTCLTLIAASVIILSGCSSNPVADYANAQNELVEAKTEQMKESVSNAPEWFLNPPMSNNDGVYATAMGQADNLMMARNIANLNAEYAIAKTVSQEVSGRERQNTEVRNGRTNQSNDETIVKLVNKAKVVGYNHVNTTVQVENGKYVVYMLLHLPYEKLERMIELNESNFEKRSKNAYSEVEAMVAPQSVHQEIKGVAVAE
ncbi:LPP20 family lipoprotein [Shewanella baltica]|uniref:LPP20 family lipoprotein n=1 Tax=Shewanella baltica TaxID=62322 RepID=UPI0002112F27|nr:LPP20 family lipoprotein [Shewanella baltica]AEH16299.1 hypothetical protein Sbal117_4663 [Shewanella baltica OS117]